MAAVVVAVTALFIATMTLGLWWRQLRINRRLMEQIEDIRRYLKTNKADVATAGRSFSSRLTSAEQEQDTEINVKSIPHEEKYRYAAALAQQGYTAAGIAESLQMALAEVEQIMQLTKIKGSSNR